MLVTILVILVVLLLFLAAFILLRTVRFARPQPMVEALKGRVEVDPKKALAHLTQAVQVQTISYAELEKINLDALLELHGVLEKAYPKVHKALQREVLGGSLLFTWPGSRPELAGVLLTGHLDVVPVDPETLDKWPYPPFSGTVVDEVIHGRGVLDDKGSVVAILEAVEALVSQGFRPERTVYLGFGQDEEISGTLGAREIAKRLEERGVSLEAVLDEGGAIVEGAIPGVEGRVALVGTAEKGYVSLKLRAEGAGGHSSAPPARMAVYGLARALALLVESPFPARLDGVRGMFRAIGPAASFTLQLAFANLWLFGGLARKQLSRTPSGAATMRTTIAPTMLKAGIKENVLPTSAEGVVNFRILPGDTIASVCEHVRRAVHDPGITLEALEGATEPSPVSPDDHPVFYKLSRAVREVFPGTVVAPYLVQGMTDARYYAGLSGQVYRFSPMAVEAGQLEGVHGINERLGVEAYLEMIQFYGRLLMLWTQAE